MKPIQRIFIRRYRNKNIHQVPMRFSTPLKAP